MLNEEFYLLAQECDLAKASLLGAMTAFSYLDVSQTGTMYSAFFQAAVGLERLMKLVVIISHNVKHDLSNPTNEQLREIGHDLVVLYDKCSALAAEVALEPSQWFQGDSLERQMLVFLSKFAKASRYYNLNAIAGSNKATDPLADWVHFHQRVADEYIPHKVKEKLNAEAIKNAEGLNAYGYSRWVDGQYILVVDGMYLHALLTRSNPYCVWTLLRLLRPFYGLLQKLCQQAHALEDEKGVNAPNIPYATEFFPFFFASLDSVKRRKNWTRLFLR